MVISNKTKLQIRNILLVSLMLFMIPFCDRTRVSSNPASSETFESEEIKAAVAMSNDMYCRQGLKAGMNYEMLRVYAEERGCSLKASASRTNENWLDSLKHGSVDLVITEYDEKADYDGLRISNIIDNVIWAVSAEKVGVQKDINLWLCDFVESQSYTDLRHRFYSRYDPIKRASRGDVTRTLSPYDSLIKKYAAELGWDWRLLAALIYQESKFSINGFSNRGAGGLMQVRKSTAKVYNVDNLLDPESNIYAGTQFLKRLSRLYRNEGMNDQERIKFILAAYNAGEGRIADCRNYAASKQVDSCVWSEIVKIIPDMRNDAILQEDSVKLGKFKGYETINYVDRIMDLYNAMCQICPTV